MRSNNVRLGLLTHIGPLPLCNAEQEQFNRCGQTFRYRKLLFALAWFHAILLERRKFKSLGFNVPYEFNESDFSICHDLVIVFLDEVSAGPRHITFSWYGSCVRQFNS